MERDVNLNDVDFVWESILSKLTDLGIYTIRQLYPRLVSEGAALQKYLQLSDKEFVSFLDDVKQYLEEVSPEDRLPQIRPRVNKRGVAVDRLDDPSRPKYYDDEDDESDVDTAHH